MLVYCNLIPRGAVEGLKSGEGCMEGWQGRRELMGENERKNEKKERKGKERKGGRKEYK